jgi:hydroxylysine kinase
MTHTPLGPLLDSHPPVFGQDQVAALLSRHWGLRGRLSPLTSERDLNHRLDAPEGRFVVKIANAAEPHALTRFSEPRPAPCRRRGRDAAHPPRDRSAGWGG